MKEHRREYAKLLLYLKEIGCHNIYTEHDEALKDAVLEQWPPRRKKPDDPKSAAFKLLGADGWRWFQRPYYERDLQRFAEIRAEANWTKTRLGRLAQQIDPEPGEEWTHVTTKYGGNYSTQGFGANTYARRAAELQGLEFQHFGIETRVVVEKRPRPKHKTMFYVHTDDFRLEAKCSPLDIDIVRRKPGLTLREQVKVCWAMGVNPRVYNPFLPPGYEEKVGLDYFGGDKKPKEGRGRR